MASDPRPNAKLHKLAVLSDVATAHALVGRLAELGIDAQVTRDVPAASAYLGAAFERGTVWVRDDVDLELATKEAAEWVTPGERERCARCGYSLQGHHGATTCPECGASVRAPRVAREDVCCPACGAECPADFGVCWSCQAPLGPEA